MPESFTVPQGMTLAEYRDYRKQLAGQDKKLSSIPRLMVWAAGVLWKSSPRLVVTLLVTRGFTALQSAFLVLLGREAVSSIATTGLNANGAVLGAAAVFGVTTVVGILNQELQNQLTVRVQRTTFDLLVNAASSVEMEAYESPEFYDRLKRCETNALIRPAAVGTALIGMPANLLGTLGLIAAIAFVEPLVIPLILVSFIPFALIAKVAGRKEFEFATDRLLGDRLRDYLRTVLIGRDEAKEVRAFGSGETLRSRWTILYDEYIKLYARQSRRRILFTLALTATTIVVVGAWIGLVVVLYKSGRTPGVDLLVGGVGAGLLLGRIVGLASDVNSLYESGLFLKDFRSFVDEGASVSEQVPANPAAPPAGGFEEMVLENVSFRYPGAEVAAVSDVSLTIRKGEVVALVGENGSGKTTLAKLLALLYRPTSGRILWDGVDVSEVDRPAWRKKIAVIFQDFVKYQLTGVDNVGLGDAARLTDREGITASARHAGADSFIAVLPEGYDTYLSKAFPGGADLSIGQWQRVALARAFFRDAPFLILDEPTAALDARAEHSLFESIRHLRQGRTVLLISHRFSSVRSADRIFVMKEGDLVEQGNHDSLMAEPGLYAELYNLQAAATLAGRELDDSAGREIEEPNDDPRTTEEANAIGTV